MRQLYSAKPFLCHYYGTAKNNFEQYLKQEKVKYKKYFYVLRPLLACAWIEHKTCPPPVLFDKLLDSLANESLRHDIEMLRAQKTQMNESETGAVIPSEHAYIEDRLAYYSNYISPLSDVHNADCESYRRYVSRNYIAVIISSGNSAVASYQIGATY